MSTALVRAAGAFRAWRSRAAGVLVLVVLLLLALGPSFYWLSPLLFRVWGSRSPDVLFRVPTAERAVALTIDDGPDPTTTFEILDVLDRHEARATFFLIGSRARRHPELVREIVTRGHEVGNHMWEDVASRGLDSAAFERRLLRTHRVLSRFAAPRWLRPGGGWYSDRMVRRAEAHGYRLALGTIYPFDTVVRWPGLVARFVVGWARPGSIVILHDGEGRGARTADALRRALPALRRRGYRVTTISALVGGSSASDRRRRPRVMSRDRILYVGVTGLGRRGGSGCGQAEESWCGEPSRSEWRGSWAARPNRRTR